MTKKQCDVCKEQKNIRAGNTCQVCQRKALELTNFQTWLSKEEKTALDQLAKAYSVSKRELLRLMLEAFVKQELCIAFAKATEKEALVG